MKKICKKLLVLATTLSIAGSAIALSGCNYTQKALTDTPAANAEVTSQGGWVVKKGDWIYFINGRPTGTATTTDSESEEESAAIYANQFGEINKGALMRIKESDLNAGKYDAAETVVPLVVTGENYDSGIYIYGDSVYYATPTVAKDLSGNVQSGYVDFKSSSLDGSKTMKDYYFRSSDSTARYRYVEVDGVVYCLHVDGSNLRSYNTETGEDVLLVKGGSSYTFNDKDQSDPYVYYTMSVTVGIDSQAPVAQDYNQVYRVRADATATLSVNKGTAKIGVTGGKDDAYTKEYTFNADYLEEADQKDETDDFSADKIEDYPYVNLGRLVLDGIGGGSVITQYNQPDTDPSVEKYTYSIMKYDNDGIYYTRSAIISVGSSGAGGTVYYLNENKLASDSWNAIAVNNPESAENELIAKSGSTVTSSAYFYKEGDTHYYIYASGSKIYRAEVKAGGEKEELCIADNTAASKFLGAANDGKYSYIYYTVDGSASSSVCRAVYDSTEFDGKSIAEQQAYYNRFVAEENAAYQPTAIYYVGHILSWYAPEIIGNNLYFVSGETVGSVPYDYAHVTSLATDGKLRDNAEQKAENDKLDELNSLLAGVSSGMSNASNLIQYYYFTGETELFEEVLKYYEDEGYTSTYKFSQKEQDCFDAYIKGNDYVVDAKTTYEFSKIKDFNTRDYFYHRIGLVSEDEQDSLNEAWKLGYLQGVIETDEGLEGWQWALIGVAIGVGALGIVCAITIPLVLHHRKNKIKQEGSVEKRKKYTVDMTYDESIDVYDMGENDPTEEGKETEAEVEALDDASDVAPVIEEVPEETPAEAPAEAETEAPAEPTEDKE